MKNIIIEFLKQIKHFFYVVWNRLFKIHIMFILNDRERLDPSLVDKHHPYLRSHLNRYLLAKKMLSKNDRVLDLACGTGYGTAMLSSRAKHVFGVDLSKRAIWFAKRRYQKSNVEFQTGDFFDSFGKYDVVVSFETLEHIMAESFDQILVNLESKAKKLIIGSVPYLEKAEINPHHFWFDLNIKSFDLLTKRGKLVFYYQNCEGKIYKKLNPGYCQNLIFVVYRNG